jgi:molybdopterin-guanine dinucleotide biosynthesis protein A
MITLILVGGNSQRFLDAGYTKPKCLLPMPDYGTMLEWVVRALPCQRVVIAGREKHRKVLEPGVHAAYRRMIRADKISAVWAQGDAQGPLYGVLDVQKHLSSSEPLLISYCDVVPLFNVNEALRFWRDDKCESGAVIFESRDPRFGYWDGKKIYEKEVVSHWAVSGLFYFSSAADAFKRAWNNIHPGAGIVHMLDERTRMYPVQLRQVLDLGTPESYQAFMAEGIRA